MGNYYKKPMSLVNNSIVPVRQYYDGDTIPLSRATGSLVILNTSAVAPSTFAFDGDFRVGAKFELFVTDNSGGQTITLSVPADKNINLRNQAYIGLNFYQKDLHKFYVVAEDLIVCDGL